VPGGDKRPDELGWFVEGLAVLVSGQLDGPHAGDARAAIDAHWAPERLADAWSGRYRYGVSGSLVRYLDRRYGRATLKRLLSATDQAALLGRLHVSETELLEAWAASVVDSGRVRRP
jgi:hypothetical protein